jgi:hypothetical protein
MVKFFEPAKGIIHNATKSNQIPHEVIDRSIEVKTINANIKEGVMPKQRRRVGFVADSNYSLDSQTPVFFSQVDHTLHAGSFDLNHDSNKDLTPVHSVKNY